MMARAPCPATLDLLGWETPDITPVVPIEDVRAASLRGRISRAVALVLRDCDLPREDVAQRMSDFLGKDETVTKAMVDAYASQAREAHTISAIRLVALAHATGDLRPLQVLIEPLEQAIVPRRFVPAIQETLIDQEIERLTNEKKLKRAQWRGRS
jgi:hypothetical protein